MSDLPNSSNSSAWGWIVSWVQFFTFADPRRAFSANVQSTTCCGLTVIFSFALNIPTEIHSSTTESGTREIAVKLLAVESIEPLGHRALELQEFFPLTRH